MMNYLSIFYLPAVFLLLFSNCSTQQQFTGATAFQQAKDSATTIFLVRHAEKVIGPKNPDLTEVGIQRADDLEYLLREVTLDAVYSTDYVRTMQTVRPTAIAKGLEIRHYDPRDLETLVDKLLTLYKGKTVLIVGHSNTTPELANLLTGSTNFPHFNELVYDNILVVTAYGKGTAKVLQLKFGAKFN